MQENEILVTIPLDIDFHKELCVVAKAKGVNLPELITEFIKDAYYTQKYGDLNEIFATDKEKPKQIEVVKHTDIHIEAPQKPQEEEKVEEEKPKETPIVPKSTKRKLKVK